MELIDLAFIHYESTHKDGITLYPVSWQDGRLRRIEIYDLQRIRRENKLKTGIIENILNTSPWLAQIFDTCQKVEHEKHICFPIGYYQGRLQRVPVLGFTIGELSYEYNRPGRLPEPIQLKKWGDNARLDIQP